MCYDCGCGIPNDPMGKGTAGVDPQGKSITDATFEAAAKAEGITPEQAKRNTLDLLQKVLSSPDHHKS